MPIALATALTPPRPRLLASVAAHIRKVNPRSQPIPGERSVREHGAPTHWPSAEDFAPDAKDLDLAYDLAWTAAHSIAAADGADALSRFYAAVAAGKSGDEAAATIGTTESALRKRWRADLAQLADR